MPVPQGPEGKPCNGDDVKFEPCNLHPCMLPDEYLWSSWSICSKTCGKGMRKRFTKCGGIRSKYLKDPESMDDNIETTTTLQWPDDTTPSVDTTTLEPTISGEIP